jgi:hypothetical protein
VPQRGQKPRSAADELANSDGLPRVQAMSGSFTAAHAKNGPPTAFWHMRQWQIPVRSGTA